LNVRKGNTQEEDQVEDWNNRLGCYTPRRRKIMGRKCEAGSSGLQREMERLGC
jgi:hypothetical protein